MPVYCRLRALPEPCYGCQSETDGWNKCDSWPGANYYVKDEDGAITVLMPSAEYFDGDGIQYTYLYDTTTDTWDIYWKSTDD